MDVYYNIYTLGHPVTTPVTAKTAANHDSRQPGQPAAAAKKRPKIRFFPFGAADETNP